MRSEAEGGAGGEAPARAKRSAGAQHDEGEEVRAFREHTSPIAFVETRRLEPLTPALQRRLCLSRLPERYVVRLGEARNVLIETDCTLLQLKSVADVPPDYFFTSVIVSNRPTNLESAYITGPGTISYNHTNTATAMASTTATVTAEASVVFTKASAALGVMVGASYSSTGGFTYSLPVPAGMRRKMQLFQQSRKFVVTKKVFTPATCKWSTAYADSANAPRKKREDEWKLVA
jgi:hypothetical protein